MFTLTSATARMSRIGEEEGPRRDGLHVCDVEITDEWIQFIYLFNTTLCGIILAAASLASTPQLR